MKIEKELFGKTKNGKEVYIYTLEHEKIKLKLSEFGANLISIEVPDRDGLMRDIICGYDSLDFYENADGYQGAIVGRCANRIDRGHFVLNGVEYNLYCNNGTNHLHGGEVGFSHKVWSSEQTSGGVKFSYFSPDGEEGYPGDLHVCVEYALESNRLTLTYTARGSEDTIVNLSNHAYFNLSGFDGGDVFGHELQIFADGFLPIDERLIPTGEILCVENTPFDFRTPKAIGRDFDLSQQDLRLAGGYDHCLVLENATFEVPVIVARDPKSGRGMRVYTTQPCVQLYSGNFLKNEKYPFKGGYPQAPQHAFCLETQAMPDSINHKNFTSVVLRAGDVYKTQTAFEFFTDN